MRRLGTIIVLVSGLIAASAAPVAADTTAGDLDRLDSYSSSCTTTGGRTTCTDIELSATNFLDFGFSNVCLTIRTSAFTRQGNVVSEETGCAEPPSGTVTIDEDGNSAVQPVSVTLFSCNARRCDVTDTVEVSATDAPTGTAITTSSRSTTRDGSCTTRTSFIDRRIPVSGTITIDGVSYAEDGEVVQHREDIRVTCR